MDDAILFMPSIIALPGHVALSILRWERGKGEKESDGNDDDEADEDDGE